MKTGFKIISAILILSLALPFITSCHGSVGLEPFKIPDDFDTSKTYEITFWAKSDSNKAQTEIYKKAIADFEAIYPNITVKLRLYNDYMKIYNDVITNISTNTTPNVCITYPDHIATYLTGTNTVVPLDELFDDEKYGLGGSDVRFDSVKKDEIIQKYLNECYFNGSYYAIPYMRSTEACYVNKDYVEALGYTLPEKLTWDFIWEVSEAATAKNDDGTYKLNGQNVMIPFIYKSTDNMMIQMLEQLGAGYIDDDGNVLMFNETTEELLYEIAEHAESGAFSTFAISSYPANFLNAGQCVFAIDSTGGATWMGTDAPFSDISEENIVEFETVVMEIPQFDTENPKMISQGPSICIFNKEDDGEVLASWLFAQYMITNDVQIAYAKTEGYAPVTICARESEEYIDYLSRDGENDNEAEHYDIKIKATKLLLNNTDNTFVTPVFNGSASVRDAAGQLIENVVKSIRRKKAVDSEYMESMFEEVKALCRLDAGSTGSAMGKDDLGALPTTSVILLSSIGAVWCGIAIYAIINIKKKKQNRHNRY